MSIQGNLEDISIVELIQMPVRERKDALISIVNNGHKAELVYDSGNLNHAQLDNKTGEEAVYELIHWLKGNFKLSFEQIEKPKNVYLKIENLIMEGIRRLDDSSQNEKEQAFTLTDKQTAELNVLLHELSQKEDFLKFISINNHNHTKIFCQLEKKEISFPTKQNLAILNELLQESSSNKPEDAVESIISQTKANLVLSQRLNQDLTLTTVYDKNVPLGQFFLTLRRCVENINKILKS